VLVIAPYQRTKVARRSSFTTWALTCRSKCAPFLVQRVLFPVLGTSWFIYLVPSPSNQL